MPLISPTFTKRCWIWQYHHFKTCYSVSYTTLNPKLHQLIYPSTQPSSYMVTYESQPSGYWVDAQVSRSIKSQVEQMSKKEGLLTIGPWTHCWGSKMVQEHIHRKAKYGPKSCIIGSKCAMEICGPSTCFATLSSGCSNLCLS